MRRQLTQQLINNCTVLTEREKQQLAAFMLYENATVECISIEEAQKRKESSISMRRDEDDKHFVEEENKLGKKKNKSRVALGAQSRLVSEEN